MLNLYDSLTGRLKPFPPDDSRPTTMYACGPTVYHYAHIGNLRTYAAVDLLRRYLEYRGHRVKLVMNITDVGHMLEDADRGEDKMEAAAAREGKTPWEIAAFYTDAFFKDVEAIGLKPADVYPKATDHVPEMIGLIEKLLANGKAYVTEQGDVYYDVGSFKDYGKLSGNTVEELVAGARVEGAPDKRHPADFALWINNPKHVMQWKAPWGSGYPGWHLECSAMSMKYIGETIDLHAAGEDLKFPHHECEIAQSEGATGRPFVRHWFHVKHLLVEGEKMSKSKGNFYTLSDLVDKGFSPEAVRFLLLSAHYRTQLNFTIEGLRAAEKELASLRELAESLESKVSAEGGFASGGKGQRSNTASPFERQFQEALDDDLNVSSALAVVRVFARGANRALADGRMESASAAVGVNFLKAFDGVFGLRLFEERGLEIPPDIESLVKAREEARGKKDWAESDRLRALIEERGFEVEDAPEGAKIKKRRA